MTDYVANLVRERWDAVGTRKGRLLRFRRLWRAEAWERDWPLIAPVLEGLLRAEGVTTP